LSDRVKSVLNIVNTSFHIDTPTKKQLENIQPFFIFLV